MDRLLRRLNDVLQYARLTPFDTSTNEGRSREMRRRALLTAAGSAFMRLFTFAVTIVSLRVALPYLNAERYGVLAAVISLSGLLSFADLGINNGLVSQIARLDATRDGRALAQLASDAIALLSAIGVAMAIILTCVCLVIPMHWLFKDAPDAVLGEARTTLIVFVLIFSALLPLGAVQRIYMGLQEGYTWYLWCIPFVAVGLALVFILPRAGAGVPAFLMAVWGLQSFGSLPLLAVLRARGLLVRPSRRFWRAPHIRSLLSAGGFFFALQVATQVGWASDSVFISAVLGPRAVAQFVVVERMFMLVLIPISIISSPLWAAYSAAAATGNWSFVRHTLRHSLAINLTAAFLGSVVITLFGETLARVLTAGNVVPGTSFLVSYGVWVMLGAWNVAMGMYLNGLQVFSPQFWTSCSFAVVATLLKITVLPQAGVQSIPLINVAAFSLTILIPFATVFRKRVFGLARQSA